MTVPARYGRLHGGAVTVEMAIVAPLLVLLVFSILEVGLIIKDALTINQAAREGVRAAAVGASIETIETRVRGSAPSLNPAAIRCDKSYRTLSKSTGAWSGWTELTNIGSGADLRNIAPVDAQVMITVTYPHQLVAGQLFSGLSDKGTPGTMTLGASLIMRRE
ncbi:pilus assembly protein [bacterium]|nr:pilus assembly protein [bacterium]